MEETKGSGKKDGHHKERREEGEEEESVSDHEGMIECIDEKTGMRTWLNDASMEDIDIGASEGNEDSVDDAVKNKAALLSGSDKKSGRGGYSRCVIVFFSHRL